MSFLDNIISKNNSGDDFVKYKDIVLNLDVCLLMLKNGDIEYINPAGEALISRINGCSKEDYDCEICEKQINLLLEQGIGALSNSMRQRYSYITAINGQRTVFYIKIEIYKLQMDETRLMVRFEDYTDQYLAEEYMKSVNKTNSMISKISSRFLGNYDKDKAVNEALRDVGMLTGADRVYVFELLKENTIIDNTYEWCNKEIDSLMEKRKQLNFEDYTWWIKEINAHEKVWIMRDCKDYDCSLNDINILNLYNITSLFVFPIKSQNEIVGFIGADNISPSCEMNNEINKILSAILAFITMYVIKLIGDHLFKRESMGGGDIKLMFLFGLVIGYPLSICNIFLATFIAFPIAIYLLLSRKDNLIPFGPFLAMAAILIHISKIDINSVIDFILK